MTVDKVPVEVGESVSVFPAAALASASKASALGS